MADITEPVADSGGGPAERTPGADLVSWRRVTSACGAYVAAGAGGAPSQCQAAVTHAGLILVERPLEAWLGFACAAHAEQLVGARLLLERDRVVLDDWQQRERDALAGQGWRRPEPYAVGPRARDVVTRAARYGLRPSPNVPSDGRAPD